MSVMRTTVGGLCTARPVEQKMDEQRSVSDMSTVSVTSNSSERTVRSGLSISHGKISRGMSAYNLVNPASQESNAMKTGARFTVTSGNKATAAVAFVTGANLDILAWRDEYGATQQVSLIGATVTLIAGTGIVSVDTEAGQTVELETENTDVADQWFETLANLSVADREEKAAKEDKPTIFRRILAKLSKKN